MSDELMDFLIDDEKEVRSSSAVCCWNILIVDDDCAIHEATKYALANFCFQNKDIKWYDAFSAEEAKAVFYHQSDIALVFLDVVMETDDAGLNFLKWFRQSGINSSTRIVLRTGQPGQAPEPQIIVNYDLHDYKTKTELSSTKLFTTTVSALRAYNDMKRLEDAKKGLEDVFHASKKLLTIQSLKDFAYNALTSDLDLLGLSTFGVICSHSPLTGKWEIIARVGSSSLTEDEIFSVISSEYDIPNSFTDIVFESSFVRYYIFLENISSVSDIYMQMLKMFTANVSIGLNNILLYNKLADSHKAIVMALAQITESRDKETGLHVFRIAAGTEILAAELFNRGIYPEEIDEELVKIIALSSTLHDIGKISIPDGILLKPDKLDPFEFRVIQTHPEKGSDIIQSVIDLTDEASTDYLELGKKIALSHHERWNGTGYPKGICNTEIPVESRIVSIIDVFDALINKRCYKRPYPLEECLDIMRDGRGTFFDPVILDVFLDIFSNLYEKVWKSDENIYLLRT